ncbi:DUF402 domain-containing protein [Glutamicibacter uratoxydans]|uniref:DUF402 domain-containing protein n=1 Tax=Glutamicibacter uratoxydans TaxID=43667 RepID=UPI003D6ECCC0
MSAQHCPQGLPRTPESATAGELVVARAWKYDGRAHWVVPGFLLGSDEHGQWIYQPQGSLVSRPGHAFLAATDALCLVPRSGEWVGTFYGAPGEDIDIYLDVSTQIGWKRLPAGGWEVNSIDMDLDVIRSTSRGVFLDDEDEFAAHTQSMGYPAALQESMRAQALELLGRVHENSAPFNPEFRRHWLDWASQLHLQD